MLTQLSVNGFAGIPYLEGSALMRNHGRSLRFSLDKPNVVVGPNGSGKSALLTTLALRFLSYFSQRSAFDRKYVIDVEARAWWTPAPRQADAYRWLAGLHCETDDAPVIYYRPGHVPGNELSLAHAAMGPYWEQAQAYARLVENRSSGQRNQALLEDLLGALEGRGLPQRYEYVNWEFGEQPRDPRRLHVFGYGRDTFFKAEVLKSLYRPAPGAMPLCLMDEPEQSLDARAEALLWTRIAHADCRRQQIIAATHSLYPLLHRDAFHLIETEPGFADEVLALVR